MPPIPPIAVCPLGLMAYAVEWNPFDSDRLAVSASQNFGIIGTGEQIIARYRNGALTVEARIPFKDGVYDCAWSETNPHHIASACGDGSVNITNINTATNTSTATASTNPNTGTGHQSLRLWHEHTAEVYSVDWNLVSKDRLVSGSWDYTIKLWNPHYGQSQQTYKEHSQCVYATVFHPRHSDLFASCAGDGLVKVWSVNDKASIATIAAHQHECLTVDWNKYNEYQLISGSVDRSIRGWDMRQPTTPLFQLDGHQFAVRRVKYSPHVPSIIGSVSYDMSFILWDSSVEDAILAKCDDHTEFVLGLDFNNFDSNLIATASWDETVHIYRITQTESRRRHRTGTAAAQLQ